MALAGLTLDDLVVIANRVGVRTVLAPSSHRGQLGFMGTVVGPTLHHTGTANTVRPEEDYPDYEVVKEGRTGLRNSLSAFGLGRWTSIYVFSECLSWHAGEWLFAGITDGNGHFLGVEAAGIGDWTDFQRKVYPRLVASILLHIGEGIDMMPRHADGAMPRGRKTDAANLWDTFEAEVQFFLDHPEQINVNYDETPAAPDEEADVLFYEVGDGEFHRGRYYVVVPGSHTRWVNWTEYKTISEKVQRVQAKTLIALAELDILTDTLNAPYARAEDRDWTKA